MCKDRFLFFENYNSIAEKLPDDLRLKFYDALMKYVFKGVEPEDVVISALITAIKPSLDKEDTRGGYREGAGRKHNQNESNEIKINQKESKLIKVNQNESNDNQNNQSFLETGNKKQEIITPLDNKLSISPYRGNEYCSCDCKRIAKFEINGKKFCGQHTRIELSKLGRLDLMPRQEKLSFSDVLDWESLFQYWEENKKGGMYKTHESRTRMLDKLKELTNNDFNLAKLSICHAIDNKYQGFCNGGELFYKPPKGVIISEEQKKREKDLIKQFWGDEE